METDRPLEIGNLRKMFAWGEHFPQIANRPCSVCHPVDPFGVGIINICMNTSIRSPRETKGQPQAGEPPAGMVFVSRGLLMLVFMQMLMIPTPKGSTSRSSTRIRRVFEASNPFLGHQKIEKSKMLRIEFWTSDFDVKKWSKRPWDPHNRIRLEKLCPKVVSDLQNAGRMSSKQGFSDFRIFVRSLRTRL